MEGLHTSRARPSPANSTESWTVLQRLLDNYEEGNTGWRAAKPLAEAFSEALLGHQRRGSPEQLRSAPPPCTWREACPMRADDGHRTKSTRFFPCRVRDGATAEGPMCSARLFRGRLGQGSPRDIRACPVTHSEGPCVAHVKCLSLQNFI